MLRGLHSQVLPLVPCDCISHSAGQSYPSTRPSLWAEFASAKTWSGRWCQRSRTPPGGVESARPRGQGRGNRASPRMEVMWCRNPRGGRSHTPGDLGPGGCESNCDKSPRTRPAACASAGEQGTARSLRGSWEAPPSRAGGWAARGAPGQGGPVQLRTGQAEQGHLRPGEAVQRPPLPPPADPQPTVPHSQAPECVLGAPSQAVEWQQENRMAWLLRAQPLGAHPKQQQQEITQKSPKRWHGPSGSLGDAALGSLLA